MLSCQYLQLSYANRSAPSSRLPCFANVLAPEQGTDRHSQHSPIGKFGGDPQGGSIAAISDNGTNEISDRRRNQEAHTLPVRQLFTRSGFWFRAGHIDVAI